jgi:hypothetical protein
MNRRASRLRLLGSAVICVLLTGLAAAQPAAATNGGNPAPWETGCLYAGQHQYPPRYMYDPRNGRYVGWAAVEYSTTCQTEWVEVQYVAGYEPEPSVWMQNQSGTNLYTAPSYWGDRWTYQLAGMRYRAGCGGVQLYAAADGWWQGRGQYLGWYYLGCY